MLTEEEKVLYKEVFKKALSEKIKYTIGRVEADYFFPDEQSIIKKASLEKLASYEPADLELDEFFRKVKSRLCRTGYPAEESNINSVIKDEMMISDCNCRGCQEVGLYLPTGEYCLCPKHKNNVKCGYCGNHLEMATVFETVDGVDYCPICARRTLITCVECGNRHRMNSSQYFVCVGRDIPENDAVKVVKFRSFKKGKILRVNRGAGIELEFSEYKTLKPKIINELRNKYFYLTSDSSVNGAGKELVSNVMKGKLFEDKLKEYLSNVVVSVDKSCGFHVHINTKDFKPKDIKHLFRTYKDLEKVFFTLVPESRQENKYCLGFDSIYRHCKDFTEKQTKTALEQTFYSETVKRRLNSQKNHKYNSLRYAWANFHSLFSHFNIEIRLHNGTTSYLKILHWIALNVALVEYVKKYGRMEADGLRGMLFRLLTKDLITDETFTFFVKRQKELNHRLN